MQRSVVGICLYIILAIAVSGIFRGGFFDFYNDESWPWLAAFATGLIVIAMGPALAAFASWKLFGPQNRIASLTGGWPTGALAAATIPALALAFVGFPNDFGWPPALLGAAVGGILTLYTLGEEIGWRGYLTEALQPMHFVLRIFVVAAIWWLWHLWFLADGFTLQQGFVTFAILCGVSAILAMVVAQTRSLLMAAAFHSIGNISFFAGSLAIIPQNHRLVAAGIAFVLLLALHEYWKRKAPQLSADRNKAE